LVTWQVFRISTVKNEGQVLAPLISFLCVYPTCNFFLEYDPRFSVAPSQNVTSTPRPRPRRPAHLHFPNKTIQRCAQFPNNSRTIAVAAILPRSSIQRRVFNSSPLDLCYANQVLHQRLVHRRLTPTASNLPPDHIYIGRAALSQVFRPYRRNNGQ